MKRDVMLFYKVVSNNHTHFSILNKEYVERDEYAEVENINVVLHSHLCTRTKREDGFDIR